MGEPEDRSFRRNSEFTGVGAKRTDKIKFVPSSCVTLGGESGAVTSDVSRADFKDVFPTCLEPHDATFQDPHEDEDVFNHGFSLDEG